MRWDLLCGLGRASAHRLGPSALQKLRACRFARTLVVLRRRIHVSHLPDRGWCRAALEIAHRCSNIGLLRNLRWGCSVWRFRNLVVPNRNAIGDVSDVRCVRPAGLSPGTYNVRCELQMESEQVTEVRSNKHMHAKCEDARA